MRMGQPGAPAGTRGLGRMAFALAISLDLTGRRAVVVGGGVVGEDKARSLLEAGAVVTVIAERFSEGLRELAMRGELTLLHRAYLPGDLEGAFIAVAATNSPHLCDRGPGLCRHPRDRPRCGVLGCHRHRPVFSRQRGPSDPGGPGGELARAGLVGGHDRGADGDRIAAAHRHGTDAGGTRSGDAVGGGRERDHAVAAGRHRPIEQLPQQVAGATIRPPAVIVIGEVVRFRNRIRWFDQGADAQSPTILPGSAREGQPT